MQRWENAIVLLVPVKGILTLLFSNPDRKSPALKFSRPSLKAIENAVILEKTMGELGNQGWEPYAIQDHYRKYFKHPLVV